MTHQFRSREEIEEEKYSQKQIGLIIEVLLDIRDLLQNPPEVITMQDIESAIEPEKDPL